MNFDDIDDILDRKLGLHEEITVSYVVDGYVASLMGNDGVWCIAKVNGATPLDALRELALLLKKGDE